MAILKKILLAVLCMQLLMPNNLLQDIAQLPILVAHHFHNSHKENHLHFTDFIANHCAAHGHHDKDHDKHKDLPFHSHDFNCQHAIFNIPVLDFFSTNTPPLAIANTKTTLISRQSFPLSTVLSSIWRPPKFA